MEQGIVKWFNDEKGYGFISQPGKTDVFVHYSGIVGSGRRTLTEGAKVQFEVIDGQKGLAAINVECIELNTNEPF